MANQENVFAELDAENISEHEEPTSGFGEIDMDKLSDVPIGQQKKYVRQNLDGKELKILKAQIFGATKEDETISAMDNPNVKYKKARLVVTFDSKNTDGVYDREYYSGAIQFVQKDGSLSEPKFWREGSENQTAAIWEKVAAFKKVKPNELSPRAFIAFLNSGVKAKLEYKDIKYKKDVTKKNIIKEFIA